MLGSAEKKLARGSGPQGGPVTGRSKLAALPVVLVLQLDTEFCKENGLGFGAGVLASAVDS